MHIKNIILLLIYLMYQSCIHTKVALSLVVPKWWFPSSQLRCSSLPRMLLKGVSSGKVCSVSLPAHHSQLSPRMHTNTNTCIFVHNRFFCLQGGEHSDTGRREGITCHTCESLGFFSAAPMNNQNCWVSVREHLLQGFMVVIENDW